MRVLCSRPASQWHGAKLHNVELIAGPADDEEWQWTEDPQSIDGLFCSILPRNLDDFTNLKWVQIDSAGFSQLIPADLPNRQVVATNASGVFDIPIAEWCVSMMISLARDMPAMMRNQSQGIWDRDARFQKEIRGSTVGFWGYGGLARETARLCQALGLRVHVLARSTLRQRNDTFVLPQTGDPKATIPDRVFSTEQTDEFLQGLDFLVMALPLTDATRGICGEEHLRQLKPSAYLLNPARGPLIHEQPLIKALTERWFSGAALDTHYEYPLPSSHPLWAMNNVIITPHISGSTGSPGFCSRIREIFTQNLSRFVEGQQLINGIPEGDLRPQQLR
tara:strand:+ start:28713 stop:29717 length:1005 start_codon:yes stop_codon:yes gene_type:complete